MMPAIQKQPKRATRNDSENPYGGGRVEDNFISNYLNSLNEDNPKLFDFFVTEAKKRKLIPKRDYSLDNLKARQDAGESGHRSHATIYGQHVVD